MPCVRNVWARVVVLAACVGLVAGQCVEPNIFDSHWVLADRYASCTDACVAAGRTCLASAAVPTTEACINAISNFAWINRPCVTYSNGVYGSPRPFDPSIYDGGVAANYDDVCYYINPSASYTFDCNAASAQDWSQRLCPCTPDSPPPSPPPPSPPPPPVNALCIQGYWPLFLTASEANALTVSSSSHTHVFGGVTYYMPDSFVGSQHGGTCPSHATLLSPSPPPPSPPSNPPLCPVAAATCTDHAADEAAATAACAGDPLCFVAKTVSNNPITGCGVYATVGTPNANAISAGQTVDHSPAASCEAQGLVTLDTAAKCEEYADTTTGIEWGGALAFTSTAPGGPHCHIYWSVSGSSSANGKVYFNTNPPQGTCDAAGLQRLAGCICCAGDAYHYQSCICPATPSLPPPPPLQPLGDNAVCIHGESPLFTSQADADAHSPTGTSTATSWDLGNGASYWKPDGYPWATASGDDACLEGTTTELIPIHLLPRQTCGGGTLTFAEKYPYATATEAANACNLHGCGGGLAPASALNSSWYAWTGNGASKDQPTSVQEQCYAAWYVNDIGFVGDGGTVHAHEQLFFMHSPNPGTGCGSQGLNHWVNVPVDSAAACLGCDYHYERCPSPPPASPPPPDPPAVPPPVTPSVAEPISPLAVIGIVIGGLIGSLLFAMLLICACAGPAGYAAQKAECDNPPDRYKEPKKFKEWQQKCDEFKDRFKSESSVGGFRLKL